VALLLAIAGTLAAGLGGIACSRLQFRETGLVLVAIAIGLLAGTTAGWLWRASQPSKLGETLDFARPRIGSAPPSNNALQLTKPAQAMELRS
jgi:hypothetical protein